MRSLLIPLIASVLPTLAPISATATTYIRTGPILERCGLGESCREVSGETITWLEIDGTKVSVQEGQLIFETEVHLENLTASWTHVGVLKTLFFRTPDDFVLVAISKAGKSSMSRGTCSN